MKLERLQQQFAKALHYQAEGEACGIISDSFSAEERMQIYRNNFIISLSEVLQATYPTVQALLGEECFLQIARQHVLNQPLSKGDVSDYGQHFDHTLQRFDAVMQAAPYCTEVARFEWALDLSQQCFANVEPVPLMPLAQLAQLPPEKHEGICFHLRPDAQLFASQYALFSLHHAVQNNEINDLNIHQPEQGVIITSSNGVAIGHSLVSHDFHLLQKLQKHTPLAEIEPQLLSSLNAMIELGVIAGFTLTSSDDVSENND